MDDEFQTEVAQALFAGRPVYAAVPVDHGESEHDTEETKTGRMSWAVLFVDGNEAHEFADEQAAKSGVRWLVGKVGADSVYVRQPSLKNRVSFRS